MLDVDRLLSDLGVHSLAELRGSADALADAVCVTLPVHEVQDQVVRGVPVRRYRPAAQDRPVLLWFHGGGYVSGGLDAIDPTCRQLAARADVEVVSVGYRLAPEHRFPAALDDCLAVTDELRPSAVGGDSAGGGIAAAVASRHPGLRALLLLCPWLDATLLSPSVRRYSSADGLNETALRIYAALYADDPADPGVSPLTAADLGHTPPAIVVSAGRDPLRDDAERYVDRLLAEGRSAVVRRWDDELHGFPGMTAVTPAAEESLQWAADQLRRLLSSTTS